MPTFHFCIKVIKNSLCILKLNVLKSYSELQIYLPIFYNFKNKHSLKSNSGYYVLKIKVQPFVADEKPFLTDLARKRIPISKTLGDQLEETCMQGCQLIFGKRVGF